MDTSGNIFSEKVRRSSVERLRYLNHERVLVYGLVGAGICTLLALALTYRYPIAAVARPEQASFSPEAVEKGAALARIGDCSTCHTADGGGPFAGGRPLATPFGTLFSTNITPDEGTGIGSWSPAAFRRAMRSGVSRDGKHLYPALPYEHFIHATDADLDALYAFHMTRRAIATTQPVNRLYPPLGFRPLLAGWKMLFLHGGIWQPRNDRSAEWNRGAYLVEGFAHCGGCHTPRNIAGGEIAAHAYADGWAEGWYAPPINGQNPAARDWTIESLYTYLRTGIDMNHAAAAGPMGPVTYNLARAPASDVHAIAVYVASLMGKTQNADVATAPLTEHPDAAAQDHPIAATLFAGACSGCHGPGAPMMTQGRPLLSLGSAVQEAQPRDVVQIILHGLKSPTGGSGPYMPAFADSFTDSQIAEIAGYLRSRYTDHPAWPKLREAVAEAREEGGQP